MLGGGCRVTRSPRGAVPWVYGPVAARQESRHLSGAAARRGGGTGRRRFVGVDFPSVTSGLLRIFPGRTCLPGDDSGASASPTGHRQSPALAKTPSASSQPTVSFEEEEEWAEAPALVRLLIGVRSPRAGRSVLGHAGAARTPVVPRLPVLSVPTPG